MANLGDKLTVGDREGVVVRAVKTAEGLELTVLVPDENTTRPVSLPVQDVEAAEITTETTENRLVDVAPDNTAADKAAADRKAAATKPAAAKPATAKGADNK